MQNSDGQVYRPSELLGALRKKTMQCTDGGQHDSHELLRHLLECVRNEDLKVKYSYYFPLYKLSMNAIKLLLSLISRGIRKLF